MRCEGCSAGWSVSVADSRVERVFVRGRDKLAGEYLEKF